MNVLWLKQQANAEELERMYLSASDDRTAQRLQAIYLRARGKTPPEIAAIVGRHVDTVRTWIKLYNEGGPASLEYKHTGGRACKLVKEQEEQLVFWLKEGRPGGVRWTLKGLSEKLLEEYGVNLSQQQISERVVRLGLRHLISRPRRRSPAKLDSARQSAHPV